MLSLKPSKLAIAINSKTREIVYYHPEEIKTYDKVPHLKYKIGQDEADRVYEVLEGSKDSKFPANALRFYEKAKEEFLAMKCKIVELPQNSDAEFLPLPLNVEDQRDFGNITGSSGAGKSVFTSKYIELYHLMNPSHEIYIFSKKDSDPAYDKFKYITRVPLDETFLERGLDVPDFKNSLVIMDDIENIMDKSIKNEVYKLKDAIAETGRSINVNMILCNHLAMCGQKTKIDLNESNFTVIFKSSSKYHIENLLKKYVGLDKKQITDIIDINSRWVYISKTVPMYIVSEKKVMLL